MHEQNRHTHVEAIKVLLVGDNRDDVDMVRHTLCPPRGAVAVREGEFDVGWAPTRADALERLNRDEFAVVLLDLNPADSQGLEALGRAAETNLPPPLASAA